jgi:hypothetical protein
LNRTSLADGEHGAEDTADRQTPKEKQEVVDADPRMVFGETEFKNVREKYTMPKHVVLPQDSHGLLGFDTLSMLSEVVMLR